MVAVAVTGAISERELKAWARDRLSGAERPKHWLIVGELPLGSTGKVDVRRLADSIGLAGSES